MFGLDIIAVLVLLAVFAIIAFYVFKKALSFMIGIVINTVLGLIAIFCLNALGLHIPINLITLIITAIFGLLGVAVLAILAIFGIVL